MLKKNTQNSELETQCLFGEQITVLQTEKNWSFCKLKLDGYLGWIKNKSFGDYFKNRPYYFKSTNIYL